MQAWVTSTVTFCVNLWLIVHVFRAIIGMAVQLVFPDRREGGRVGVWVGEEGKEVIAVINNNRNW